MIDFKTTALSSFVIMVTPIPALANCWNAADTGVPGPSAEICIGGVCEATNLDFECANAMGLMAGYANGLHIEVDVSVTPEKVIVSKDGTRFSDEDIANATCAAADPETCKVGTFIEAAAGDAMNGGVDNVDIAAIKSRFDGLLGVDASGFQEILIETGFLTGNADGVWGPATEAAVSAFVVAANEMGFTIDATSDETLFYSMNDARAALFNPNSGLSRYPFDGAHLLVVASRSSYEESEQIVQDLEARLASIGFAGRTGMYPAMSGVIAITSGMYPKEVCKTKSDDLKANGIIPQDSYCLSVEKIDPLAWTN